MIFLLSKEKLLYFLAIVSDNSVAFFMRLEDIEILQSVEVRKFIENNQETDPHQLILKYSKKNDYPISAIAEQILCIKKAKKKLPSLTAKNFIFEKTALEQSSGEIAAKYKLELLKGERLIDLTGGLGIDFLTLSQNFNNAVICEKQSLLVNLLKANLPKFLDMNKIVIREGDSIEILKSYPDKFFDWIYADPARRDKTQRSVDLNFCSPNVLEHFDILCMKSKNICLKLSPAFDLAEAKRLFPGLSKYIVLSVEGECKEVLLIIYSNGGILKTSIEAVAIDKSNFVSRILVKQEKTFAKITSQIKENDFLFIPDPAIIKTDLTGKLATDLKLAFFNVNNHWLVGETRIENFPGRVYQIIETDKFNEKEFKRYLKRNKIKSALLNCKGTGISTEEMRKKMKLKDGGNIFFFFTRNDQGEVIYMRSKQS